MFNVKNQDDYYIFGRTPAQQPVRNWESVEQLPQPVIEEIQGNRRIAEKLNAAGKELPGNLTEFIFDVEDCGEYGQEVFFRAGFAPVKEGEQPYALLLGKEGGRDDIGRELYAAIEERKLKPLMERIFQNVRTLELTNIKHPTFTFENPLGKFELKIFDYRERFLNSLSGKYVRNQIFIRRFSSGDCSSC